MMWGVFVGIIGAAFIFTGAWVWIRSHEPPPDYLDHDHWRDS